MESANQQNTADRVSSKPKDTKFDIQSEIQKRINRIIDKQRQSEVQIYKGTFGLTTSV